MSEDLLASLRPPGGWSHPTAEPVEKPAEPSVTSSPAVEEPEAAETGERWLLACIDRGHVRTQPRGTSTGYARSCAHTAEEGDVTDAVAGVIASGHAARPPGGGTIKLTVDGRRRLADLEREDGHR